MSLRTYRVYASSLDVTDPERIVTTHHARYKRHWFTLRVRAGSSGGAWGFAKHMTWARSRSEPGVVEAWQVTPRNELVKLRGGP